MDREQMKILKYVTMMIYVQWNMSNIQNVIDGKTLAQNNRLFIKVC